MYFLQQLLTGLAIGLVYGGLALAISLVYKGGGALNVAQGEQATVSALIASTCLVSGLGWPIAIVVSLVGSFLFGIGIFHVFIRPIASTGPVTVLIVTVALSLLIDAFIGSTWGYLERHVSSPFGTGAIHLGSIVVTNQQLGMACTILFVLACAAAFFRLTLVGLKMRAAAINASSARLIGLHVTWYLALSWGLAGLFGGVVGVVAVPLLGLDPTVFLTVLIYAFSGAVLGGIDNLPGATLGGVILGVVATVLGAYVPLFSSQLNIVPPFIVMMIVLVIRPVGIFGQKAVTRV